MQSSDNKQTATKASETNGRTTLVDLKPGQAARIKALDITGADRRRLMDLGFVPGARVAVELNNPMGDPRAFSVMGGTIAVRRSQARLIEISLEEASHE